MRPTRSLECLIQALAQDPTAEALCRRMAAELESSLLRALEMGVQKAANVFQKNAEAEVVGEGQFVTEAEALKIDVRQQSRGRETVHGLGRGSERLLERRCEVSASVWVGELSQRVSKSLRKAALKGFHNNFEIIGHLLHLIVQMAWSPS